MTNRLGLMGGAGISNVLPDSDSVETKSGLFYGGRIVYGLSSHWLLSAGASRGEAKSDPDVPEYKGVFIPYELGLTFRILGQSRFTPYLQAGAGITNYRTYLDDVRQTSNSDFSAHGGAGLQLGLTDNIILDVGARYHWISKEDSVDLVGNGDRSKGWYDISAMLGLFTNPLHSKDTDMDGVSDSRDKCPDTPRGAIVDDRGCPKDTDGDGVFDGIDQCPDTPVGAVVDAQGCPKDSDGDGVPDGVDQCPNTAKGCAVDAQGCPKDADGDGVCDGVDQCPDTPSGTKVDERGCTVAGETTPPPSAEATWLETIHFDFDRYNIKASEVPIMQRNLASLKDNPSWTVTVYGHCDWIDTDEYNDWLGGKRADSAKNWLVSHGIESGRITTVSKGKREPKADNTTDEGRAENRRDEFEVHK